MTTIEILKKSLRPNHRQEPLLLLVVFACVLLSSLFIVPRTMAAAEKDSALTIPLLSLFLLLDQFLRIAVFSGVKEMMVSGTWTRSDFFRNGWRFLARFILYNLYLGLAAVVLICLALAVIFSMNTAEPVASSLFYMVTVSWIGVPFYFVVLSLMSPLIVLMDDCDVLPAVRRSIFFARAHLDALVPIVVLFAAPWAVVLFSGTVYNSAFLSSPAADVARSMVMAALEFYAFKTLMLFYHLNKEPQ